MAVNLKRMVKAIHSLFLYIVLEARMRVDRLANLEKLGAMGSFA